MKRRLNVFYQRLYAAFGKQYWWPAESAFEVMVGAILAQNTSWSNVEKAILALKKKQVLEPAKIHVMPERKLALLIKSAGYYNIKARRLKNFLKFYLENYNFSLNKFASQRLEVLRAKLLDVNGIGPETADSILLYALNKPIFVVDSYTKRIFSRHGLVKPDADYSQIQELFMQNLNKDQQFFNEYHALIVKLGKDFCRKNPKCSGCPLNGK